MPDPTQQPARAPVGRGKAMPLTLHHRILTDLQRRILSGDWPPGHKLPIEAELSRRYRCSRMTINKVVGELVRAGLVERRRRAGSFVSAPRSQSAVLRIQDVRIEIEALGHTYGYRRLSRTLRRATSEDRHRLNVPASVRVLAVDCLHMAGRHPFCLERRIINTNAVVSAREEPFDDTSPGPWLVDRVPWTTAEHRIRAIAADADIASALSVAREQACLSIERKTWQEDDCITHVVLVYRADAHELIARFTPASV